MTGARIAVTRAQPEAQRTAERLLALGAQPVVAPLLEVKPRAFDIDLRGAQALLFTSANGVRAAAAAFGERALPALTVGDATARAARDVGFLDVRSASGDVGALAVLANSTLNPKAGGLIYLSGADVAGNLLGWLHASGFTAMRRVVYESRAVAALPPVFADALDIVVFHSARAAQVFLGLGAPKAAALTAACISPAVAAAAERAAWARVVVSPKPQEEALWEALGKATLSG